MISANRAASETDVNSLVVNLANFIHAFWEIGSLKRICAANSGDSFAANLFQPVWRSIRNLRINLEKNLF